MVWLICRERKVADSVTEPEQPDVSDRHAGDSLVRDFLSGRPNTYPGLIFANTTVALPFAITILRPFFLSIPKEISEAARIDGCNLGQAFFFTIVPVSLPGILTVAVFTFLSSWGDLLFGLTIVTQDSMRPVTAGLWKFMGSNVSQWNMVMALATMEMLPPFMLFLLTQRYVVAGLTAGSVK